MTVKAQKIRLNAEQKSALDHILSLSDKKQKRFWKLIGAYHQSYDDTEKEEIALVIGEMLWPDAEDYVATPLKEETTNKDAKAKLRKHREYVAKQIEKERNKRGWTQTKLSVQAGLPQSHVSRLEACKHAPTYLTIKKLADALGIEPGILDPEFQDESGE